MNEHSEHLEDLRGRFLSLLFVYFIVSLMLHLPSWIGLLPPLERALQHIHGLTIGKILYCALPLLVWLYARLTHSPWNILFFYLLLEGWKHLLRIALNLRDVLHPFGILVLPIVILSTLCLYMVYKMYVTLLRLAKLQSKLDHEGGQDAGRKDPLLLHGAMVLWILLSYFAIAADLRQNTLETLQLQPHEVHATGKYIQDLAASPDGKLLAVGTPWSLSVWDVGRQRRVWYGKGVSATRVRFSLDGRYLAAYGGEGSLENKEGILNILEVEGLRRLPGVLWPQEGAPPEGKEARRRIHAAAFRADGSGLLVAWDYSRGPLFCTEVAPRTGRVLRTKKIEIEKFVKLGFNDHLPLESAFFSPDASHMLLPDWGTRGRSEERFFWFDTRTWESKEIGTKEYRSETVMNEEERDSSGLRLSLENNRIRFFASTRGRYGDDWRFVLLGLDPETQKEDVILTAPETSGKVYREPWADFSLSPNGSRLALLGRGETEHELGEKAGLSLVRIADLETGASQLIPLKFKSKWPGTYAQRIVWVTNDTLAIGLTSSIGFFIASADKAGP